MLRRKAFVIVIALGSFQAWPGCASDTFTSDEGGEEDSGGEPGIGGDGTVTGGAGGGDSSGAAGVDPGEAGASSGSGGNESGGGGTESTGGTRAGGGGAESIGGTKSGGGGTAAGVGGAQSGMGGTQSGTGGSASGNGGNGGTTRVGCANEAVIDDMEDGDSEICVWPNRSGNWYVEREFGVGTTQPAQGEPFEMYMFSDRPGLGVRFTGSGFEDSGDWALVGAWVNGEGPYDATRHTGIRFWGRAGPTVPQYVVVNFATRASSGVPNGGICLPSSPYTCDNHWGALAYLRPTWQEFEIPFSTLERHGDSWGIQSPKDLTGLLAIEFMFNSAFGGGTRFTFYIDDVTFY